MGQSPIAPYVKLINAESRPPRQLLAEQFIVVLFAKSGCRYCANDYSNNNCGSEAE